MVRNTMPAPNPWAGVSKYRIEAVDDRPYLRVYAVDEVDKWIRQQPVSQWKYDDDDDPRLGRSILLVMPQLATLLQLRWS